MPLCRKKRHSGTNLGGNGHEKLREAGASKVAVGRRKVSASEDGLQLRGEPDTHGPATATTEGLHTQGSHQPTPHTTTSPTHSLMRGSTVQNERHYAKLRRSPPAPPPCSCPESISASGSLMAV